MPVDSINLIREPNDYGWNINYLDLQVYLDLDKEDPFSLRAYAVPIEYSVFMPLDWDKNLLTSNDPAHLIKPEDYFALDALPLGDENLADKLKSVGSERQTNSYGYIKDLLKSVVKDPLFPNNPPDAPLGAKDLRISPTKLFLAIQAYAATAVDEVEAQDRLELTLDKLSVIIIISAINSIISVDDIKPLVDAELDANKADVLIKTIIKYLKENNAHIFNKKFEHKLFWDNNYFIEFPKDEWKELFAQSKKTGNKIQLQLPLDYLDKRLRIALEKYYGSLSDDLRKLIEDVVGMFPESNRINDGYRFLYNVAELLSPELNPFENNKLLNIYKMAYREEAALLPVIQEIDARHILWMKQANQLSYEWAICSKDVSIKAQALNALTAADASEFYRLSEELRVSTRKLYDIRENIEVLRDKVSEEGFVLSDGDPIPSLGTNSLKIERKWTETWVTYTPMRRVDTWQEWYRENQCFLFFCINVWKSRTRSNVVEWIVPEIHTEVHSTPMPVEWRPIDNYLDSQIPSHTYTIYNQGGAENTDKTSRLKEFIAKILNKDKIDGLKNRDKDVRIFTLYGNGYRDQYGISLEKILFEAENVEVRAKLLLILPIYERQIDGSAEIIKYIAVHNPVAPRKSYLQPRVFLVETYAHKLEQLPGHWLGPVSHTVCLFPGESRRLKLISETRYVTQQKQESRFNARTSVEQKNSVHNQVKSDLSNIRKDSKKSNWNANASGGANFGFWNASGGASGGEEKSSSEESAAQYLTDQVTDSLRNVSESNEVQFVNASDTTLTESSTTEQIIEFQNVNQGRSVTHKFFQVLHKFRTSIELKDLRVVVEYGERLIPGYDIYQTEVYRLDELDLLFPLLIEEDRVRCISKIKELIKNRVKSADDLSEENEKLIFKPFVLKDVTEWYINSGSYFVDTEVSREPATEPYVNDARNAEIDIQKAKAERLRSEGKAITDGKLVIPSDSRTRVVIGESNGTGNIE